MINLFQKLFDIVPMIDDVAKNGRLLGKQAYPFG